MINELPGTLHLPQDFSFLAPGSWQSDSHSASTTSEPYDLGEGFYFWDVNADPNSFAALSLCNGIHGGYFYSIAVWSISSAIPGMM